MVESIQLAGADALGFTDDSPLIAPIIAVIYGEYKIGKSLQAALALDRMFYLYTNPTILAPFTFLYRQVDTVRPGLMRELGIRDPRIPFAQGGYGKRLLTRADAIKWVQSQPQAFNVAEFAANNYAGAFYFYADLFFFPWLAAQLSPGGVWADHFDGISIDETSTIMNWVFQDILALAENPTLYGGAGLRFRSGNSGKMNIFEVYSAALTFFERHIVGLYEKTRKHLFAVCHEMPPKVEKDGSRKALGGPLLPSLSGVDLFLREAMVIWRCCGVDAGSLAKEQRRIEATMSAMREQGLDDTQVDQNAKILMTQGAKYHKTKSDLMLPAKLWAWTDDLGWPSDMRRFIQAQTANEYRAGGRAPFTPGVMPLDIRGALAYGGFAQALPRLSSVLSSAEMQQLRSLGSMQVEVTESAHAIE